MLHLIVQEIANLKVGVMCVIYCVVGAMDCVCASPYGAANRSSEGGQDVCVGLRMCVCFRFPNVKAGVGMMDCVSVL